MNFIHTIKFRFTLWYLAILSILMVLLSTSVYLTLAHVLHRNFDQTLMNRAKQIKEFRDIISILASGTFEDEAGEFISFYFYADKRLMHISNRKSEIRLDTEIIDRSISGENVFLTIDVPNMGKLRFYLSPYKPDNPKIAPGKYSRRRDERIEGLEIHSAALCIARPLKYNDIALQHLLRILLFAVPLTILISGMGGVFLAKRAFKPIDQISATALEIEENDLSRRIEVTTKDELGRLASTLNQMIERLEKAFERQKQFTSDASHELRAPLAIIQAETTLSLQKNREPQEYRKSLQVISQEVEYMSTLINQLLLLARADAGKEYLLFESIELGDFIREVCSDMEILCMDKDISLEVNLCPDIVVKGDKKSLKRLIHNILDNAIKYTHCNGSIRVMLEKDNDMAVLSVSDTGIGIPEKEQLSIFERFYRVDKARSRSDGSSGLGLAICQYIIKIHKGTISVESQIDKGSIFYIKLPMTSTLTGILHLTNVRDAQNKEDDARDSYKTAAIASN
ncbi:MAG: HAMP domain-containing protein [Desulfobacterales bacterium]|nr:HAMP domain-containing protein [Desulfobacterales bacterium]